MPSLKDLVRNLETDLRARPPRHYIYNDLPFAVFCYPPQQEWEMRREMQLLKTRLEKDKHWQVNLISLAELLWQSVDETEGMEAITALEKSSGFPTAQSQVYEYLSDPDWRTLPDLLGERLNQLDPKKDLVFLWRAGALAPEMYRVSTLLDKMKGRTSVSCVLFMPATSGESEGLRFMGLADLEPRGSYHTKIYVG
jgi:hypothetical protein